MNLGVIITTAIAIIVGVVLFQVVAQQAGETTNLVDLANVTVGIPTNGTTIYLTAYRLISDPVIINGTTGVVVSSGNYTITNNVIDPTTGGLSVSILPEADTGYYGGANTWYISGSAQTISYIPDGGSRSVVGLIAIFFALAIVVIALEPTLRGGVLDLMGR